MGVWENGNRRLETWENGNQSFKTWEHEKYTWLQEQLMLDNLQRVKGKSGNGSTDK